MSEKKVVDCRGLSCPQPVLQTKEALQGATLPLLVIVDNEGSCTNVARMAESQGAQVSVNREGGEFYLEIVPGEEGAETGEVPLVCSRRARDLVVYISSEGMGRGDEELGAILMAAFLDTLSQFQEGISHLLLVNSGVKLAVEGSPVLGQIRQLEEMGVQVFVCGTCLNHFGLKEKLAVGSVSNMYEIIQTLSQAGRTIRP